MSRVTEVEVAQWETPALVSLIHRRLLPHVCSYCVFLNASVSVARRGLLVACHDLLIIIFLSNFKDLAILKAFNTETLVYRIHLRNVTFILNKDIPIVGIPEVFRYIINFQVPFGFSPQN